MKTNNKYESPDIKTIDTRLEGILCSSDCPTDDGNGHGLEGDQNACNVGGFPGLPGTKE